jgi:hypothetical protein
MKRMISRKFAARLSVCGLVAVVATLARSRMLHWGATSAELREPLPGDSLVPRPQLESTRAITIQRPPEAVWSWIAQLGQGRAGFYSYDFLENLVGMDIHSADHIVPAWQKIRVGDDVHLAAEVSLAVAVADAPRALVLRGGVPMGGAPSPFDSTWAFVLRDAPGGAARLLVRERYRSRVPWTGLMFEPVAVISFIMSQKMMHGIRDRAEAR